MFFLLPPGGYYCTYEQLGKRNELLLCFPFLARCSPRVLSPPHSCRGTLYTQVYILIYIYMLAVAWWVVRVHIKINFVGSSLTECMLIGTFSCINKLISGKRESVS